MIHEIMPEIMDNQYRNQKPEGDSRVLFVRGREILVREGAEGISYPRYGEVRGRIGRMVYLFSVGGRAYFLAEPPIPEKEDGVLQECGCGKASVPGKDRGLFPAEGLRWMGWEQLRDAAPRAEAFAGMTGIHLHQWYQSVQFCGRCGKKAVHHSTERMMYCPSCGNLMFPRIAPAVIVAVTDGERLLLTKYAGRENAHFALVAGFVEIGETAEECVRRELLEEVGIHVKDIRYYGSQPWGFAGNLMLAYTARLDGTHEIDLDRHELAEAAWLLPEEIPEIPDHSSLTREMIRRFKEKKL